MYKNPIQENLKVLYHDQIKKSQESEIEKVEDEEIEKGGEGSRGGKVIGHTKSGKPIYDSHNHEGHNSFSYEDHHDAARAHVEAARGKENENDKRAHYRESNKHVHSINKKINEGRDHGKQESGWTQHSLYDRKEKNAHKEHMKKTHGVETKISGDEIQYTGTKEQVKNALKNHYGGDEEQVRHNHGDHWAD